MRRSRQIEKGFLSLASACFIFVSLAVHAGQIDKIEKDLDDLYKRSKDLPALYLASDKQYGERYVSRRFVDGENFYRIKDYERAAVIFLDIIDHYKSYVAYSDAMFLYADALFLDGNLLAAKHAFERFLAESNRPGAARFKEKAAARLLEIAVHTKSYAGTGKYLRMLSAYSTDTSRYVEGKFFYFRKDFKRAETALSSVQKEVPLKLKALYLIGAIYTMDGRYADALSVFERALSLVPQSSDEFEMADLLTLGAARIQYELGQFDEALKYYRRITESSRWFDASLYESASAQFQAGDPKRAEQTLEVLMISVPESRYRLRAEMLRGHLLLRDERFDEAEDLFNNTIRDFVPMIARLDTFIKEQEDPQRYFWELVESNLSSLDMAVGLPPLALKWVEDEPDVKRALKLNGEFNDAQKDLKETKRLLRLIEAVVNGSGASDVLPLSREGKRQSALLMNRLSQIRFALLEIGEDSARGDTGELSSLRSKRAQYSKRILSLPLKEEDLDSREDESKEVFLRMNAELQRNAIRLDQSDAVITAIEKFITDARYREGIPKETLDAVKQKLSRSRTANEDLRKKLSQLRDAVEEAKYLQGLGNAEDKADAKLRDELRTLSEKERSLFQKAKGRTAKEIERLFLRIDQIETGILSFEKNIHNESAKSLVQIQAQMRSELENLNQCENAVARLSGEMREVVGGVTYENLTFVRKRFRDLVVKADVGILDSAWLRKEAHTAEITKLNEERQKEIRMLEADFQEMTSLKDKDSK